MPLSYDCERIFGTIEWAHATLRVFNVGSGYAMDQVMKERVELCGAKGRPGLFARYLRGDCVPRPRTQVDLEEHSSSSFYLGLPIWDVLRVGFDGYSTREGQEAVEQAVLDVERWFEPRLTRYAGPGLVITNPQFTPPYGLRLCAHGSNYALTVLLNAALWFAEWSESETKELEGVPGVRPRRVSHATDPLRMGQRAFQCMVLSFAAGEFPVTAPLVAARVRQRILDRLIFHDKVLDTAAIDLNAAMDAGRQVLREAQAHSRARFKQRAWLQSWLKSGDSRVADMTPTIVEPAIAEASRQRRPVVLRLQAPAIGRHGHQHELGSKARDTLLRALHGYVVAEAAEDAADTAAHSPMDASGARYNIDRSSEDGSTITSTLTPRLM